MSLIAEIFVYILTVLGIIVITITVIDRDKSEVNIIEKNKSNSGKVLVEIKISGMKEREVQNIAWQISKGKFKDIYDIADEYKIYMKE